MTMQRGPKAGVDPSPLPFKSSLKGAARFAAFCRRYIVTPKGHGVGKPMILRPWQVKLVGAILDPPQRPRTAGIMMPRGQGKTSLMAALCVYTLFTGPEGTSVVVAAVDQRQAELTFKTAARMVELNPELLARCQVFRERLEIPAKGWHVRCPAGRGETLRGTRLHLGDPGRNRSHRPRHLRDGTFGTRQAPRVNGYRRRNTKRQ